MPGCASGFGLKLVGVRGLAFEYRLPHDCLLALSVSSRPRSEGLGL